MPALRATGSVRLPRRGVSIGACTLLALLTLLSELLVAPARAVRRVVPDPYPNIQSAIDAAGSGDSIQVGPGTYFESLTLSGKDVVLYGDSAAASTRIDGGHVHRVLLVGAGVTAATELRDLTLQNGWSDGGGALQLAGGASPTIRRCRFVDNTASRDGVIAPGGALCVENDANVLVEDCLFEHNLARFEPAGEGEGGAIFTRPRVVIVVRRSVFRGNVSGGRYGGPGGAMFLQPGSAGLFESCTFDSNTAFVGSVVRAYGNLVFSKCTFRYNFGAYGAAIACSGDGLRVEGCLFHDNVCAARGGAIFAEGSSVIRDNTIAYNSWGGSGASLDLNADSVQVSHNIVVSNDGIGIFSTSPTPTVACNDVWNNVRAGVPSDYGGKVWNRTGSAGNISADPLFCDAASRDLRLHANSPCGLDSTGCGLQGALPIGCGKTAIEVADLEAHASRDRVLMSWRLSGATADELLAVRAQRAEAETGPYDDRAEPPLVPSASMSFEDTGLEAGRIYWYRLLLVPRQGNEQVTAPLRVRSADGLVPETALDAPLVGASAVEIRFRLGALSSIRVAIYDATGRRLRRLENASRPPGEYVVRWDRRDDSGVRLVRGIYWVRFEADGAQRVRKFSLLRRE